MLVYTRVTDFLQVTLASMPHPQSPPYISTPNSRHLHTLYMDYLSNVIQLRVIL